MSSEWRRRQMDTRHSGNLATALSVFHSVCISVIRFIEDDAHIDNLVSKVKL